MPEIKITLPEYSLVWILGLVTWRIIWGEIRFWRGKK